MKLAYRSFYALCIMFTLLYGCAQLGLATPQTFNERLAVGYSTVTAIRTSATTLLQAKKITADDGQNVLQQTDNARTGLDIARNLQSTNPTAAADRVVQIQTALTTIQTYLTSRSK